MFQLYDKILQFIYMMFRFYGKYDTLMPGGTGIKYPSP